MDIKKVVKERYSEGAKAVQPSLCCPVNYDPQYLKNIPQEIIEKDYGCGDPSAYVRKGDTVLDLGSGGGKVCYIAAQIVGENGKVYGIDMNDDMLELAKRHQAEMSSLLGNDRVKFIKGHIQDLSLNLESTHQYLKENPVNNVQSLESFTHWQAQQRRNAPLLKDETIDIVISNCVLNLVEEESRHQMIQEIFRVLKPGGRVAISDIISDDTIPTNLKNDKELWSGCISGAFTERELLNAFETAGFLGCAYDKWDATPWQTIGELNFRSATIVATKPIEADCNNTGKVAALYKGAFTSVELDSGEILEKGIRTEVSANIAKAIEHEAYGKDLILVDEHTASASSCSPTGGCC